MERRSVSCSELVNMYNACSNDYVKAFSDLPDSVKSNYREKYFITGQGECEDCGWFHCPEGCNVDRDSNICKMNKRLRSPEWIERITAPSLPVMEKYNICSSIIEQKDKGKYHGPFAGPSCTKNMSPWDFGPSNYVKETFKNYIEYYYINFVEFDNNNSQELYDKLIDDSADGDRSAFNAIRMMFGINSGVLVMHFPLLMDKSDPIKGTIVSGRTPLKPYVVYTKEHDEWREYFFSMENLKKYLDSYIRSKEFTPTSPLDLRNERVLKNDEGAIIGICGDSDMKYEKTPDIMIGITEKKSPYVIAKDVFKLESAISMLRVIKDRKLFEDVKEIRQMLETVVIDMEKRL